MSEETAMTEGRYDELWSATVHRHTAEEQELRSRQAEEMLALVERSPRGGVTMQRRHWLMVARVARESGEQARLREAEYRT